MKNGVKYNWSRRNFLKTSLLAVAGMSFIQSCKKEMEKLIFRVTGTNHILGHRLRTGDFPKPTRTEQENILIIGGGIAGLSAARWLVKNDITDFKLIELEQEIGGNSLGKEDQYSRYPVAAHYLPLPNHSNSQLIDFLYESNIITGFSQEGFPQYDESQLCIAPHERLFIHNYWQEGLIPNYGLSQEDLSAFSKFDTHVLHLKNAVGNDGLFVFDIPLHRSSRDENYTKLDQYTFLEWLKMQQLVNDELYAYLNYCCKDDYGIGIEKVSAWAGLHYFCSRKNTNNEVLTWPEGNYYLTKKFLPFIKGKNIKNQLVYKVDMSGDKVKVALYDNDTKSSSIIYANKVILATPQFINQYLLNDRKDITQKFQYAPWLTATLSIRKFPMGEGAPLAWDNVIHKGSGLGYIYNQHQMLQQFNPPFSITYYTALCGKDLATERRELFSKSDEYWKNSVLNDLEKAHYGISKEILSMELHKKGHGMISPVPSFLFSKELKQAAVPIANKIFFAHSDLSGISIFEEAFYQGIKAAKQLINETTLDS